MKIKKIRFKSPAFRMFKDMEMEIADRLTVIAGHNGIGKSTLLGLIANGSEMKAGYGKTLLRKPFQAQLHELFYLDEAKDYVNSRGNKPMFELEYHDDILDNLIKTCKVSKHTEKDGSTRLKVVPRGSATGWNVGHEAKVPIPTIFLSMSRMLPLGETQDLLKEELAKLEEEDKQYIYEKFKQIVSSQIAETSNVIRHELKSTTKRSLLPEFTHSAKAISLGQDSLSSIITALASFNKIARKNPDTYKGGILLIDEIDAGFHARVQVKLIELLKKEAKRLKLQIIMTSHSLFIIEEVLKITDDQARNSYSVDTVIYLTDIYRPTLMKNPTYEKIRMDMIGELPSSNTPKPQIKLYFEDNEAVWFCRQIFSNEKFSIEESYKIEPIFIGAKLGWDNIRGLYEADEYFKSVVIILDNDVLSNPIGEKMVKSHNTILTLPALLADDATPDQRTLEYQLYDYLYKVIQNVNHPLWDDMPEGYTIENIRDRIIDSFPHNGRDKKLREVRKDWFNQNKQHFEALKVVQYFCQDNKDLIIPFINNLRTAIECLLKSHIR